MRSEGSGCIQTSYAWPSLAGHDHEESSRSRAGVCKAPLRQKPPDIRGDSPGSGQLSVTTARPSLPDGSPTASRAHQLSVRLALATPQSTQQNPPTPRKTHDDMTWATARAGLHEGEGFE